MQRGTSGILHFTSFSCLYYLSNFVSPVTCLSSRVTGGELFEDIVAREYYSEADARSVLMFLKLLYKCDANPLSLLWHQRHIQADPHYRTTPYPCISWDCIWAAFMWITHNHTGPLHNAEDQRFLLCCLWYACYCQNLWSFDCGSTFPNCTFWPAFKIHSKEERTLWSFLYSEALFFIPEYFHSWII